MIARMDRSVPATPESMARKEGFLAIARSPSLEIQGFQHNETQTSDHVSIHSSSLLASLCDDCVYEIAPLSEISSRSCRPSQRFTIRVLLPTHSEGLLVFERFKQYVSHYHHITYMPTLESQIKGVYKALAEGQQPDIAHVTLLLTVVATVLYFTKFLDDDFFPDTQSDDREKTFVLCFRSALDLLDHARRALTVSLELIQSAIILLFLDFNLEGLTQRVRGLLVQAISVARELGMHRLDCLASRGGEHPQTLELMVATEMQRRMWWHLVATDWMLALAGTPAEGTYTIHPSQHMVNIPRNLDDSSFSMANLHGDLPLSVPTCMSYSLQRIRLAHITRHVVDVMQYSLSEVSEQDYGKVRDLDVELERFIDDLPVFLRVDNDSVRRSSFILERYPCFAMQRYIINIGAQTLRCKLHQPFMVRASSREAKVQSGRRRYYQDSVDKCMTAAMAIVRINQAIRDDPVQSIPARVKLTGLLHHMFLATMVLVTDLISHPAGQDDREARAPQVKHCIQMLEEAKQHSTAAHKFLDSLMDALKKHQVRFDSAAGRRPMSGTTVELAERHSELDGAASVLANVPSRRPGLYANTKAAWGRADDGPQPTSFNLDDLYKDGVGSDIGTWDLTSDWDHLFRDLDAFIA